MRQRASAALPAVLLSFLLAGLLAQPTPLMAQEAVVASKDAEALFTSRDPALQANKQVVYHILKDLLEANHWELADRYLAPEYHQHNPMVATGRDAVVHFFTEVLKTKPAPIPAKLRAPVVAVLAEKDLVVVATVSTLPDPKAPGKSYTTTWFDMWRISGGKATEHWDGATLGGLPPAN